MNKNVIFCYNHSGNSSFEEIPEFANQQKLPGRVPLFVHEARNPLCNIRLAGDLLNETRLDEEQRKYVDIIMRNSGRIGDLIDELLRTGGGGEVKYELYPVQQLLEEVLLMTNDRLQHHCRDQGQWQRHR
jgi:nitrogen-specific signal transduction histidine kinase